MIVISDTNIIYSCFYKPEGVIATILKNRKNKLQFIAPSYLLDEIEEHLPQIMEKNQLTKRQAKTLLKEFTKNITFYDLEDIKRENRDKAVKIVKEIDPDDYILKKDIKYGLAILNLSTDSKRKGTISVSLQKN